MFLSHIHHTITQCAGQTPPEPEHCRHTAAALRAITASDQSISATAPSSKSAALQPKEHALRPLAVQSQQGGQARGAAGRANHGFVAAEPDAARAGSASGFRLPWRLFRDCSFCAHGTRRRSAGRLPYPGNGSRIRGTGRAVQLRGGRFPSYQFPSGCERLPAGIMAGMGRRV